LGISRCVSGWGGGGNLASQKGGAAAKNEPRLKDDLRRKTFRVSREEVLGERVRKFNWFQKGGENNLYGNLINERKVKLDGSRDMEPIGGYFIGTRGWTRFRKECILLPFIKGKGVKGEKKKWIRSIPEEKKGEGYVRGGADQGGERREQAVTTEKKWAPLIGRQRGLCPEQGPGLKKGKGRKKGVNQWHPIIAGAKCFTNVFGPNRKKKWQSGS